MKRLLVVLAALALPAGAIAKEPLKVKVCGSDGCAVSKDKSVVVALIEGGPPSAKGPDAGAPSFRVVATLADEQGVPRETFATWMVPSLRLIRNGDGVWMPMPAAALAALEGLTKDLQPYPADRLGIKTAVPARRPPSGGGGGEDGTRWWLLAGIAAALAAVGAGAVRHTRRRGPAVS